MEQRKMRIINKIPSFLLLDYQEMLEKEESRYLRALSSIQHQILNINFRNKFFQLTKSYTFTFSINNIISDANYQHILLLTQQFYLFLLTKYLLGLLESQQPIILDFQLLKALQNSEPQKYMHLSPNNRYTAKILASSSRKNEAALDNRQKNELQVHSAVKSSSSINCQGGEYKKKQYHQALRRLLLYQQSLNHEYFNLTNSFKNKQRVAKLQIICFLITLISSDIICPIIEMLDMFGPQKQIGQQIGVVPQRQKQQKRLGIQQEIYLILVYQTMGKLISPKVFSCLKKKFVKHTISRFEGVNSYTKIAKSLKYLRQILSQKEVLIKDRKQRTYQLERLKTNIYNSKAESELKNQKKQNIKNFIKESLGTRQTKKYTQITNASLKKQKFDDPKDNEKPRFHIYANFHDFETQNKHRILLKAKESNLMKCSNSVKDKLKINVVKWRKQCHKKKYISNIQRTFYRLRYDDEEERKEVQFPLKSFKSERNSYKFSKLSLNPSDNQKEVNKDNEQTMQIMKLKIDQFKRYAMSDLQIINKFNPVRSKNKYFVSSSQRDPSILKSSDTNEKQSLEPEIKIKKEVLLVANQKNYCCNNLYNIKGEPVRSRQGQRNLLTKVGRNSNKLRKQRSIFNIDCKNRADVLDQDLNFMERISMKSK